MSTEFDESKDFEVDREKLVNEIPAGRETQQKPNHFNGRDNKNSNTNHSSKKRPRDGRVEAKDRLCFSAVNGVYCPIMETCMYEHNILGFLNSKPEDLGPSCYQFDTFGLCANGIMCRFGDGHIDRVNGINISRSIEKGGVIPRVSINTLSKPLQFLLRKKKYDFSATASIQAKSFSQKTPIDASAQDWPSSTAEPVSNADDVHTDKNEPENGKVKLVDFSRKVYIAPLTTVGNLPFRRILKDYGADITCGEMALAQNLEQGHASEWALLRRHPSEDIFGVQLASNHVDQTARIAKILERETSTSFVDLNCGCPIDIICNRGCGAALLQRPPKLLELVRAMTKNLTRSVTVKIRTGWNDKDPSAHKLLPLLQQSVGTKLAAVMIHGRSRSQRYSRAADWEYILQTAKSQDPTLPIIPVIGNGDIFTWEDWNSHRSMLRANIDEDPANLGLCDCAMLARGALAKPWLPLEIKESRHYDISASERLDMLKKFCNYGLEHWGSDTQGVNTTRRFLLEWLSFLHKYAPVGVSDGIQKMQDRPPRFVPRSDLEALLASPVPQDWVKISCMLLGPVPENFLFEPKHKSGSAGTSSSNGSSTQPENETEENG